MAGNRSPHEKTAPDRSASCPCQCSLSGFNGNGVGRDPNPRRTTRRGSSCECDGRRPSGALLHHGWICGLADLLSRCVNYVRCDCGEYKPILVNGQTVPVITTVTVNFPQP